MATTIIKRKKLINLGAVLKQEENSITKGNFYACCQVRSDLSNEESKKLRKRLQQH